MKQKPEAKPVNILREIEANKIAPVYLLCGKETFLIEGTLKQMLDKILPSDTRDFNLTFFDGNTVTVREILSNAETYPMMSKWRVIVVEEFPAFKAQKRSTSPLNAIRNAMQIETEDVDKCVTDTAKLLGVSTQQITDQHADFHSAVEEMSETLGGGLTEDVKTFFGRLPELAAQLDVHSESSGNDGDADTLLEWLQGDLPDTSVLIFTVKDEVSERNRIAKAIQEVGKYVSFDPLEKGPSLNRDPLYKKVVEKFATYNKKITPRAFEQLRSRTGGDMHTIAEAIDKIVNFVEDKQQIDELDIRNLVTQTTFDRIFDLTDAIGKRSTRQALKSLREVLASGQEPIPLTASIASHLRLTLQAKLIVSKKGMKPISNQMRYPDFTAKIFQPLADEIGDILPNSASYNIMKRNPYIAFKIFQTLHAFTTAELMTALEKTLEVEIQLKTTQSDGEVLLEQLVYDICDSSKHQWN
ncbi:MAG: DNA polymerase III subunit delta [Candidatus Poribacteria bacterium]|nr:DNA polymerase III subunit delta [Candidatus Poribacteria bacterium]